MDTGALFATLPKAELHLHLEGTIAPDTLWAIAERNHVTLPAGALSDPRAYYDFKGLDAAPPPWLVMCRSLQKPADYEHMVDAFVADCRLQDIRYVEAHFTPYIHERFGFGRSEE